jgi:hypothetical protein
MIKYDLAPVMWKIVTLKFLIYGNPFVVVFFTQRIGYRLSEKRYVFIKKKINSQDECLCQSTFLFITEICYCQ